MNDNNNTRGTVSGTPQRSDVEIPSSVNTRRRRTPAKKLNKRKSKAESPLNPDIFGHQGDDEESSTKSSTRDDPPSLHKQDDDAPVDDGDEEPSGVNNDDETVVTNNVTPLKKVGDDAPPKDGDDAPPNDGDGDDPPPEDGDGDGDESPPKQPIYDMDTWMFHASPLGSHSYSDWNEYFDKIWDA